MRRREYLGGLGGAEVAWPIALRAQQPDRVRRMGVLTGRVNAQSRVDTIQRGLQKLGWVDGRNIRIAMNRR